MDTSVKDIFFDENGFCNYCTEFIKNYDINFNKNDAVKKINDIVNKIKYTNRNKKYDCIIGISGGVDSSWTLIKAIDLGLRPLAVHVDNGWDSELAQHNIENLIKKLKVDLYTYVINWNEYRNLMQAFFDANVIDVEILYDNAMLAVNYQQAAKYGIKYILGGYNKSTEGMKIPINWNWFKFDKKNIKSIAKTYGKSINTFPSIGTLDYLWYYSILRIRWISILDVIGYNKFDAIENLTKHYGYKPYPYKHYESIFTRFYQGYILPKKFGVDKRRLHLGTLIVSGHLLRDDAIRMLEENPYPSKKDMFIDRQYFLKKMGWDEKRLDDYLYSPEVSHDKYGSEKKLWEFIINNYGIASSFLKNFFLKYYENMYNYRCKTSVRKSCICFKGYKK